MLIEKTANTLSPTKLLFEKVQAKSLFYLVYPATRVKMDTFFNLAHPLGMMTSFLLS